ncbi:MAG: terpene cyclase/mutase family protein, partial [Chloroflexi bacterium]|nr:terpene cyclase/mutase family protein [Chloroflexota bacterium]
RLRFNPLPTLVSSDDPALAFAATRDLLEEDAGPVTALWSLPAVERLLCKQRPDGSWPYPGGGIPKHRATEDYDQIETYRDLGILVEKYSATCRLPAVGKAAEFLFSRQTDEGDFRGIYGRQYTPNYTAGILELLVKAGYGRDPRVSRCFQWLMQIRQADGGWAIPMLTAHGRWDQPSLSRPALAPVHDRPSSHMVTGVVLRAFAAHPVRRRSAAARRAAVLLADRLFARDVYPGRDTPDFWTHCAFPFWFTDIVSALDSLTLLGIGLEHPKVKQAVEWLATSQKPDGMFHVMPVHGGSRDAGLRWVTLAACRALKRALG